MRVVSALLTAVGFLTVVPMPVSWSHGAVPMGWAVACFPLAGAAVGGLLAGLDWLLRPWLPIPVVAGLLLATSLGVTGALHLDGFMDSFDGLFGGRSRERRLEIMRDSRVGSFGVAAAGSLLLVEYSCLISLPPGGRAQALVLAATLSRWAMVVVLWGFPAASSKGLAAGLKPEIRRVHTLMATALACGVAVGCFGWAGTAFLAGAGLLALLGGRMATGRLGGVTGDICGGAGQLVEAAILIAAVAFTASAAT